MSLSLLSFADTPVPLSTSMLPADTELDIAISSGDARKAVGLCVRQFGHAIGRFCYGLLASQAEAEEAVQEAFVVAFRSLGTYRAEGSVRAWLFGIARRICAKRLQVRDRRSRTKWQNGEPIPDSGVEAKFVRRETEQRVRNALELLKPTDREALLLRFEGELSLREIGLAMGIDEDAARKRISRALDRVREQLES